MSWEFDSTQPIYIQLVEKIKLLIISGQLKPGQKLDSVRDMAEQAGVNPNTMQRALAELERDQLVFSQRTAGRFVTEDANLIGQIREDYAHTQIKSTIDALAEIGYSMDELKELIALYIKEMN